MKSLAKLCACVTFLVTGLDISRAWHHHGSESPGTPLNTRGTDAMALALNEATPLYLQGCLMFSKPGLGPHSLCWSLWHRTIWMDELAIPLWLLAKTLHRKTSFSWHFSFLHKMLETQLRKLEKMVPLEWCLPHLAAGGWEKEKSLFFFSFSCQWKLSRQFNLQIPSKAMIFQYLLTFFSLKNTYQNFFLRCPLAYSRELHRGMSL